jgi:hypothetical protein
MPRDGFERYIFKWEEIAGTSPFFVPGHLKVEHCRAKLNKPPGLVCSLRQQIALQNDK